MLQNSSGIVLCMETKSDLLVDLYKKLTSNNINTILINYRQSVLELIQKERIAGVILDLSVPCDQAYSVYSDVCQIIEKPIAILSQSLELSKTQPRCGSIREIDCVLDCKNTDQSVEYAKSLVHLYERTYLIANKLVPAKPEIILDEKKHIVSINGIIIKFTRNEFNIMKKLIKHPGRVYSRNELLDTLNDCMDISDRAIDSHIKNIRKKIKRAISPENSIRAVYGIGYTFKLDLQCSPLSL